MSKTLSLAEDAALVPNGCQWALEGLDDVIVKYRDRLVYQSNMLFVSDRQQERADFERLNIRYDVDEFLDKVEVFLAKRWPRSLDLTAQIRAKKDSDPAYRHELEKWCNNAPNASTVLLRDTICRPFMHHELVYSHISDRPGYGYHSLVWSNLWVPLDTCAIYARNALLHPLCERVSDAELPDVELRFAGFDSETESFFETNLEGYSNAELLAKRPGSNTTAAAILERPDSSISYVMTSNGRTFLGLGLSDVDGLGMADFLSAEREILLSGAFKSALSHSGSRIEVEVDLPGQNAPSGLDRIIEEQAAYYGLSAEEHGHRVDALTDGQELVENDPAFDDRMDDP